MNISKIFMIEASMLLMKTNRKSYNIACTYYFFEYSLLKYTFLCYTN